MIVYQNTTPGDETTACVPVEKLTQEQQMIVDSRIVLIEIIRAGEEAAKKLKNLQASCKHFVFYDVAGFPYDIRTCHLCDCCMGTI